MEFGLQPFRSQPRIRLVGPDGKPLKRGAAVPQEAPVTPVTPVTPAPPIPPTTPVTPVNE